MKLRKILYIWIVLLLLASASLSFALAEEPVSVMEPEIKPEVSAEEKPEVKVIQDGVQVKEPDTTPEGQAAKSGAAPGSGDTYNFYFQKSPGANKVEQGQTQSVEQLPAPAPAPPTPEYIPSNYNDERVVDLYMGISFLSAKEAKGFTLGGEFMPQGKVGARVGLIMASSTQRKEYTKSKKSIFESDETTDKNELHAADLALTFNMINSRKGKLAPLVGLMAFNEKDTTKTEYKHFWGSDDATTTKGSRAHLLPYIGLSGTAYLSRSMGINVAVAVPTKPKYTAANISFVFSI